MVVVLGRVDCQTETLLRSVKFIKQVSWLFPKSSTLLSVFYPAVKSNDKLLVDHRFNLLLVLIVFCPLFTS